jgi:hypothetical protein
MSRYTPFYLGVFMGAVFTLGAHLSARDVTPPAPEPAPRVAAVGTTAPARPAPHVDRACTQLASTHERWVAAHERATTLTRKSEGALALAILSDHDDATHYARARRFQEDAHRAERSAALALRALAELRERDDIRARRCVY